MTIEVHEEPDTIPRYMPKELCCFCDKPTTTWYLPKDVACCKSCATDKTHNDVPSKDEWWDKQQNKITSI